jgi:hypothetical protein
MNKRFLALEYDDKLSNRLKEKHVCKLLQVLSSIKQQKQKRIEEIKGWGEARVEGQEKIECEVKYTKTYQTNIEKTKKRIERFDQEYNNKSYRSNNIKDDKWSQNMIKLFCEHALRQMME